MTEHSPHPPFTPNTSSRSLGNSTSDSNGVRATTVISSPYSARAVHVALLDVYPIGPQAATCQRSLWLVLSRPFIASASTQFFDRSNYVKARLNPPCTLAIFATCGYSARVSPSPLLSPTPWPSRRVSHILFSPLPVAKPRGETLRLFSPLHFLPFSTTSMLFTAEANSIPSHTAVRSLVFRKGLLAQPELPPSVPTEPSRCFPPLLSGKFGFWPDFVFKTIKTMPRNQSRTSTVTSLSLVGPWEDW